MLLLFSSLEVVDLVVRCVLLIPLLALLASEANMVSSFEATKKDEALVEISFVASCKVGNLF